MYIRLNDTQKCIVVVVHATRHGYRVKMLYLFHYLLEAFPKMRLTFNDDMYDVLMMGVGVDGTGYFNGFIFDCLRFRQVN